MEAKDACFWAIVELMGHVRMAGFLTEVEQFGSKLGRLDVPKINPACLLCGGTGQMPPPVVGQPTIPCTADGCWNGMTTTFFGGQSVYRITPCTEEVARAVAKSSQMQPIHPWEMPKALPYPKETPREDDEIDFRGDKRDIPF